MKKIIFLSMIFLVISCKKDPIQYTFEGTVTDNSNGSPLSGASIKIYQKPFNSSLTSNNFELVGTDITDGSGKYSITFERTKATEFKIEISKNGYFETILPISSANVTSDHNNEFNAGVDGISWASFHINNLVPNDSGDNLTLIFYYYREGCTGCIEADYNYFPGVVNTVVTYTNTAGQYLKFTYADGVSSYTDSVYMSLQDTVSYTIEY